LTTDNGNTKTNNTNTNINTNINTWDADHANWIGLIR